MDIQFLGSGDAFGSGGRFNTCIHVTSEAGAFLIDCGASSLIAMRKFGIDPNRIHTIFLSHLHGDHFGGLPFLLLDAQFYSARRTPLTLVGPPGLRDRLALAMEVFFPGSSGAARKFTTEIIEMEAGKELSINGVRAGAALVQHASGAPPFALRLACEGRVVAYSGDTEWTEALLEIGRDADLFIVETLAYDRRVRHHLDYASLKTNLGRIGARRVILTHLGPDMLARLGDLPDEVAEDGKLIRL